MSDNIHFFGKVDKNRDGKIGSQYPAWSMDVHIDELSRSIEDKEIRLKNRMVPEESRNLVEAELARETERIEQIRASRPELSEEQSNKAYKEFKNLKKGISETLFSRDEMMYGSASPHQEAKRMSEPCVTVDPEIAEACGVKVDKENKVSRNDATRIYTIIGKYFGESTNIEAIRKDKK